MHCSLPELSLFLATPDDTERLGSWLGDASCPGDTILLEGPIGSGKSHLARAFVRAQTQPDEDVPSPSFTLVQTYDGVAGEIWHADLYRLGHQDEVLELGLEDAFGRAICIVEWPDRLGSGLPPDALRLRFSTEGEGRRILLSDGARWARRLERLAEAMDG